MPYLQPKYDMQGNPFGNSAATQLDYSSFDNYYKSKYGYSTNPYGLAGKIDDFFTGHVQSAEKEYEQYLADKANKETWLREDTAVQRAMKDYEAAGLNPYLLVNSGSVAAAASSQAQRPDHYGKSKKDKTGDMLSSALRIILFAAAMAA